MEHFYQNINGWFSFMPMYQEAINKYNKGVFVEVGSWKGRSASFMAVEIKNSKKDIKFYCVDTWKGSAEHTENEDVKKDKLYDIFLKNIAPVKEYIIPLRNTSLEAAARFEDESIDFVFIDASHEYEDVKKDLAAWYPKVKKEGIFAGDDYRSKWPGVIKAVDEFAFEKSLKINKKEGCWGCWFINK